MVVSVSSWIVCSWPWPEINNKGELSKPISISSVIEKHRKTKRGFNLLAPFYDFLVRLFFGNSLHKSQSWFLNELGPRKNILVFGGGTGQLLPELGIYQKPARICYVDISEKMIEEAAKRIDPRSASRVQFICGSYTDLPANEMFDLVITPYVLDCFDGDELTTLMNILGERVSEDGKWLFVDFNVPADGAVGFWSKLTIGTLYWVFNLVCGLGIKKLPDFSKEFRERRFLADSTKDFCSGMLTAKIYSRR
jgi:tRNA (cmo5U34)-methyltransferase